VSESRENEHLCRLQPGDLSKKTPLFVFLSKKQAYAKVSLAEGESRLAPQRASPIGRSINRSAAARGQFGDFLCKAAAVAIDQPGEGKLDKVTFIFNFFDELRRIAPPSKR
jgi:hypothetical protein